MAQVYSYGRRLLTPKRAPSRKFLKRSDRTRIMKRIRMVRSTESSESSLKPREDETRIGRTRIWSTADRIADRIDDRSF